MFGSSTAGRRVTPFLLVVGLVSIGAGSACDRGGTGPSEAVEAPATPAPRLGPPGADPADLLERVRSSYRPRPDARFLAAVSAIDKLAAGDDGCQAATEWSDGAWTVTCGDTTVARVPELPAFDALFTALVDWTRQRCSGNTACVNGPGAVDPTDVDLIAASEIEGLIAVVEHVDARRREGARTQADVDVAARALARLAVLVPDDLDALEAFHTATLATAALSSAGGTFDPADEVLLAYSLGYTEDAAARATDLPIGGARILATGDAAVPPDGLDRFGEWARTLTLVRRGMDASIPQWLTTEEAALTSARIRLADSTFDDAEIVSAWTLWTVARAARRDADQGADSAIDRLGATVGWTIDALSDGIDALRAQLGVGDSPRERLPFDELSAALERLPDGELLPRTARISLYQAAAFAGLRRWGTHLLVALHSVPAARAWVDEVGAAEGTVADGFATWFGALVSDAEHQPLDAHLAGAFEGLPGLGGLAVAGIYDAYAERQSAPSAGLVAQTRTLFARLDSRPDHRVALAGAAWRDLHDLALTDRLLESGNSESVSADVRTWAAEFDGDGEALRAVIADVTASTRQRARAIDALARVEPDYDAAPDFRVLAGDGEPSTSVLDLQVAYLEDHERYDEAVAAVEAFLARPKDTGLADVVANALAARVEISAGRPADAWRRVEPLVDSWQSGVMLHGARALAQLGRDQEAIQLADRVLQRYPGARSIAAVARIHWEAGRNEQAAALVAGDSTLDISDLRHQIATAFMESFAGRTTDDAMTAYYALADARLGGDRLLQFAYAAAKAERWELAARMLDRVVASGQDRLQVLALGYLYRAKAQGDDAAMEWLRGQDTSDPAFEMYAYQEGLERVLWELTPAPAGPDADYTWLERAATAVRNGLDSSPYADQLRAHYATEPPEATHYHTIGRFLVGEATVDDAFAVANSADRRCEVAYFAALHYEAAGDLATASDWYRVAVETERTRNGEYHWASQRLGDLYATGRSLAYLSEHPDELP